MKKVKWGVLGTAGIAEGCTLPGMMEAENVELVAIAGRSPEKTADFCKRFGNPKAYGRYEDVLNDPAVEAVYIPLPNDLHYEWVMKAIHAGKHVLCEKPLAPNAQQAAQLIAEAQRHNVVLMEAFAYLHSPLMHALQQEVRSGAIGKVNYLEVSFMTSDWQPDNIRLHREHFGGCTYDLGCYCTSFCLWLLGEEPTQVRAVGEFSENNIDVHATALLKFPSGARATLNMGMILEKEPFQRVDRMYIQGAEGYIETDARFNQFGDLRYTVHAKGETTEKTVSVPQNYRLEVEQMGHCITEGASPLVSHSFTVQNAKTLDRILHSIGYDAV